MYRRLSYAYEDSVHFLGGRAAFQPCSRFQYLSRSDTRSTHVTRALWKHRVSTQLECLPLPILNGPYPSSPRFETFQVSVRESLFGVATGSNPSFSRLYIYIYVSPSLKHLSRNRSSSRAILSSLSEKNIKRIEISLVDI